MLLHIEMVSVHCRRAAPALALVVTDGAHVPIAALVLVQAPPRRRRAGPQFLRQGARAERPAARRGPVARDVAGPAHCPPRAGRADPPLHVPLRTQRGSLPARSRVCQECGAPAEQRCPAVLARAQPQQHCGAPRQYRRCGARARTRTSQRAGGCARGAQQSPVARRRRPVGCSPARPCARTCSCKPATWRVARARVASGSAHRASRGSKRGSPHTRRADMPRSRTQRVARANN